MSFDRSKVPGAPPFGYRVTDAGRVEISPEQAAIVRKLFAGGDDTLSQMVRHPIYAGIVTYPEGTSVRCLS